MPRNGSNIYSKPAGTTAIAATTIESAKYNTVIDDLVTDANTVRPIVAGGTAASTAAGALTSLGAQPVDADLTAIAALTSAANKLPYATGAGTWALADLTAAGRAIIDDADAAAQLTTLGVSAFVQTLLNDADRAAFFATLGGITTWATQVATTAGTAFDFTGVPSWATEIIVQFDNVSLSDTDNYLVQLGTAGGPVSTGYISVSGTIDTTSVAQVNSTAGFILYAGAGGDGASGHVMLTRSGATNRWVSSHHMLRGSVKANVGGGFVDLGATLTRIRVTRTGANTFDAGLLNIGWR